MMRCSQRMHPPSPFDRDPDPYIFSSPRTRATTTRYNSRSFCVVSLAVSPVCIVPTLLPPIVA